MPRARPEYLNVRETARRLGVHENTVRNWTDKGLLSAERLPGSGYRRFRADDVASLARQMEPSLGTLTGTWRPAERVNNPAQSKVRTKS